jgi:hypothetical protein
MTVTVGIPTYNRSGLLRETVASVLAQTYENVRVLISDNASDDDTAEVVASFGDARIEYLRAEENVGMIGNFNRVIEHARTEYLMLLPDDDLLYPDHLSETVAVLERFRSVGVAHTAFDLIDGSSEVVRRSVSVAPGGEAVEIETGERFLERSMTSTWTVCWPTAVFRTEAVVAADGLRPEEEPLADFPLLMRIACDWDYASLSRPLAAFRLHAEAATATVGEFTGAGYDLTGDQPRILYDHRMRLLEEMSLPGERAARYRSLAAATLRRDRLRSLANRAGAGAPWTATWGTLASLVHDDPRTLLVPATWKLCGAQLGLRHAKRLRRRVSGQAG